MAKTKVTLPDTSDISMEEMFTVQCACPTPLAFNPCAVLASCGQHAVDLFKARNGILATDHPITAVPVNINS